MDVSHLPLCLESASANVSLYSVAGISGTVVELVEWMSVIYRCAWKVLVLTSLYSVAGISRTVVELVEWMSVIYRYAWKVLALTYLYIQWQAFQGWWLNCFFFCLFI
jgi:hypothetical protein